MFRGIIGNQLLRSVSGTVVASISAASGQIVVTFSAPFTGTVTDWPTFVGQTVSGPAGVLSISNPNQTQVLIDLSDAVSNGPWSFTGPPGGIVFSPALVVPESGTITDAP
jgi:hypothetical protein